MKGWKTVNHRVVKDAEQLPLRKEKIVRFESWGRGKDRGYIVALMQ